MGPSPYRRHKELKPSGVVGEIFLQKIPMDPLPACHFIRVWGRVALCKSKKNVIEFMFDEPLGQLCSIKKGISKLKIARDPHLLMQAAVSGRQGGLPGSWVAAAGV
jgi:hypothetical protein